MCQMQGFEDVAVDKNKSLPRRMFYPTGEASNDFFESSDRAGANEPSKKTVSW